MTRKDYVLIADAIKDNVLNSTRVDKRVDLKGLIYSLCWRLKGDNNNFDGERFRDYIKLNK
tara:strand:+ start:384 stop:566 length:183 start_codon:yes stop_codon:yes gene_type:complete